jgi:hypothetical protein
MSLEISKFGFALGIGATFRAIWPGAAVYPFPTSAVAVRIAAGGDANDTAAGTGARTVFVEGLGASWEPASAILTANGASASTPSTETFRRVSRAYVLTAGALEGNVGDVEIEQVGGDVLAIIPAGYGQTEQAIYTVPAGYRIRFASGEFTVATNRTADFRFVLRTGIAGAEPVRRTRYVAFGLSGPWPPVVRNPGTVYGPADVWAEARASTSADVTARFEGDLVRVT